MNPQPVPSRIVRNESQLWRNLIHLFFHQTSRSGEFLKLYLRSLVTQLDFWNVVYSAPGHCKFCRKRYQVTTVACRTNGDQSHRYIYRTQLNYLSNKGQKYISANIIETNLSIQIGISSFSKNNNVRKKIGHIDLPLALVKKNSMSSFKINIAVAFFL